MASIEATSLLEGNGGATLAEGVEVEGRASSTVDGHQASVKMRFVRDVLFFGWANVASLILNGVLSFLLPRYMTVEDFGYYRLFVLYASFAGVAHLGTLEGILVRWAEKPEERVGCEIKGSFQFLLGEHIALLVPLCMALVWVRGGKWLWLGSALAIYVLICNSSMLAQIALQARRQFSQLSFFTVAASTAFFGFVVVSKLFGQLDARMAITSFVAANLLAGLGIWKIALESGAAPVRTIRGTVQLGLENTHIGWKILVANFFVTFTPSLDRLFVSGKFPIRDFAIYAFAGNALAIVYTIAMSAARVVYPYLSAATNLDSRRRAYAQGRSMILGLWAVSLLLYFPTAYLVHLILPKYAASLPVLRLLMISSGFVAMIHVLHANYFRLNLALNRFLAGSFVGLFAVGTLIAVVSREASLLWVATAMIGGVLVWWVANEVMLAEELGNSRMGWVGTVALWLVGSAVFLGACAIRSLWLGSFVYALGCSQLLVLGVRRSLKLFFAQGFRFALRGESDS